MRNGKITYKNHGLTKEVLKNLYEIELKSDKEIGEMFGLTDVAISYYRKKYGIETLTTRNRIAERAKKIGLQDIRKVSKERFAEIYESIGERGMAKMFGCSKILIRRFRKEYGINSLEKRDRINIKYPAILTEEQKSVLFGSLLGDGGLTRSVSNTARYFETHCLTQKDYLRWKQSVFLPFSGKITSSDKLLEDGRIAYGNTFRTCFHSVFYPYWEMFYLTGKKRLPSCFEEKINPLALATWYMDDGHLSDRNKDGVPNISCGFPEEDLSRIEKYFNFLGFDVEVKTYSDISIIWINNKIKFFEMIGEHIHPSMRYKIPLSLGGVKKPIENVMIKVKNEIENKDIDIDLWVEKVFRYLRVAGFSYPYCTQETLEKAVKTVKNCNLDLDKDIPSGYTMGSSECLSFLSGFWEAKRKGNKSPIEVFEDDDMLRHAIRDCIKYRKSVSDSAIRAELGTFGGVHNFRPVVAKAIINRYCRKGGTMLDPCAGWGGRLFGFYCSEAFRYVGVEAEKKTVEGLKKLSGKLGNIVLDKTSEIFYNAFEDWNSNEKFDLVFTSPPYFDAEEYGQDSNQSIKRYKDYVTWKYEFLFRLVDKSMSLLHKNGFLVLNIANISEYNIADELALYLSNEYGIETTHKMIISSPYGKKVRWESLFVCRNK